jgi:hypothetical protein
MKVITRDGELIGYPSDNFTYEFQGYYKTSDEQNSLMFYGYILNSQDELIDKSNGSKVPVPTTTILFTLPLKDKEIQYKDKNTGESKSFTQKSKPQYLIIKWTLDNFIGENTAFKACLTTEINEGLCNLVLTGINPMTNEKVTDIAMYQVKVQSQIKPEKISIGLENKLLSLNEGKKSFQKTYVSESEKLNQRLTWLCENYISIVELARDISMFSKETIPVDHGIAISTLISTLMNSK